MTDEAELLRLRQMMRDTKQEKDDIEDRYEALLSSTTTHGVLPAPYYLTQQQFEIVRFIRMKSPNIARLQSIENWIYGLKSSADIPNYKTVPVQVSRIRKRLPEDVKIRTVFGVGYMMPVDSADNWDSHLAAEIGRR